MERLKNYIFGYASSTEIKESSRDDFYQLLSILDAKIAEFAETAPEPTSELQEADRPLLNDTENQQISNGVSHEEESEEDEKMDIEVADMDDLEESDNCDAKLSDEDISDPHLDDMTLPPEGEAPPYFYMGNKKKKKFFNRLKQDYQKKVETRQTGKKIRKVKFQENRNQVLRFSKREKLPTVPSSSF